MPRMMVPDINESDRQHLSEDEEEKDDEESPIHKRLRRTREESSKKISGRRKLPERSTRKAAANLIAESFIDRKSVRYNSRSKSRDILIAEECSQTLTLPSSSSTSRESSNEPIHPNTSSSSSSRIAENERKATKLERKRSLSRMTECDKTVNELAGNFSTFKLGDFTPIGPQDGDHDSTSEDEDEPPPPDTFLILENIVQKTPVVPDSESGDYEVERILLIRKIGKILYYLLKWKDYPLYQMSWAKQKDLRTCNKVIKAFEERAALCKEIYDSLPNKHEYRGYIDHYVNSIITPAFNEQNLFENELVPFMIKNHFAPLYIENWTQMCDVLPKEFVWTAKCLFSYPTSLEVKKWEEESKNSIEKCDCEICDPKICPCLKSMITSRGYVRSEISNFITECSKNCGCNKCPSKVFRAGRTIPIMLFKTQKCGWSVRTMANIPKRRFVMEYVGLIKIYEECEEINDQTYLFNCDLPDSSIKFVIDATEYGNESRFINHHCEPNLEAFSVLGYSNPSLTRIVFFSNRDIEAGEELTFDYFRSSEVDPDEIFDPKEKRICRCGAKKCRKFLF